MSGWNVSFRASIVRVAMLKLFGTGIVAALLAVSPRTGRYVGFSLSLSAAVNFVAVYFYYRIWQLRARVHGDAKHDHLAAVAGREELIVDKERQPLKSKVEKDSEQEKRDRRAIYWQEVEVDESRFADWLVRARPHRPSRIPLRCSSEHEPSPTSSARLIRFSSLNKCTLVLLTLDLGHLREYLHEVSGSTIPPMRLGKEILASMQALMILLASVYRFYTNEARPTPGADVTPGTSRFKVALGWASFVASSGVFGVIVWALLDGLPDESAVSEPSVRYDLTCLRVLVLVWCGYPLVMFAARMAHWNAPGDEYFATWSLIKDISFAFLDVASKAGVAIFFILKVTYLSDTEEAALLAHQSG